MRTTVCKARCKVFFYTFPCWRSKITSCSTWSECIKMKHCTSAWCFHYVRRLSYHRKCFSYLYTKVKSLNNRNFIITFYKSTYRNFCVLFFDIVPLLRNTLGPPVHKLADAPLKKSFLAWPLTNFAPPPLPRRHLQNLWPRKCSFIAKQVKVKQQSPYWTFILL